MNIIIGEITPHLVLNLNTCKKHQYDSLVDECKKAKRNNHKEIEWMGQSHTLQFANYLVEYLSPKFKDMK